MNTCLLLNNNKLIKHKKMYIQSKTCPLNNNNKITALHNTINLKKYTLAS